MEMDVIRMRHDRNLPPCVETAQEKSIIEKGKVITVISPPPPHPKPKKVKPLEFEALQKTSFPCHGAFAPSVKAFPV